jgi:hypothetical protein
VANMTSPRALSRTIRIARGSRSKIGGEGSTSLGLGVNLDVTVGRGEVTGAQISTGVS